MTSYIETRIVFKNHLIALLESELDEVKPKLKAKIKELWTKLGFEGWKMFQLPDQLEHEHNSRNPWELQLVQP